MRRGYSAPNQTVSQFQLKGRYARQYQAFAGKSSKDFLLYLSGSGVYDSTAADVESTPVGEQIGGISTTMVYDGALLAGLFGLHYKNETDSKGNTVRYAFNAATLRQSTVAWKNSNSGFFVSRDGGKTWGYGWETDDTAVKTAILLEQTLKELDDRYQTVTELSEKLLLELDER